ncbi:hypothetical protein RI129_006449 [Pyrocoelia pectoralis]|uniref:Uncharacterized protein n=1 Tax=Pyrocoelia pectoralis TaxID=417401 RepID=A0AAN7VJS2_9COLE
MAKLIYSMKIYLFRSQFKLTTRELSRLQDFNVFVLQIYLKCWYTSPCGASTPYNDLKLLKELDNYKEVSKVIAAAAVKSFSGHLWYLSETLVGLPFFDSKVPSELKVKMMTTIQTKQLCDFVSQNTLKLFAALEITKDFLNQDPGTLENNKDFLEGRRRIQNLKVVNDAAERGISLIQSFNGIITNQEEQKQYLLQVIEKHRQDFPNSNKSTVVAKTVN